MHTSTEYTAAQHLNTYPELVTKENSKKISLMLAKAMKDQKDGLIKEYFDGVKEITNFMQVTHQFSTREEVCRFVSQLSQALQKAISIQKKNIKVGDKVSKNNCASKEEYYVLLIDTNFQLILKPCKTGETIRNANPMDYYCL